MTQSKYFPSKLSGNIKNGILHLGLGAFHRAHQAFYTQQAITAVGGHWGIEAVSMRDPSLADALARQEYRYTLIERHTGSNQLHEMTVIQDTQVLSRSSTSVTDRFLDPNILVVTLTITEKGYCFDPTSRQLDKNNPSIAEDLSFPREPKSALGVLVEGLRKRKAVGLGGMSILSCDNLSNNGDLLKSLVLEFAHHTESEVAQWIEDSCTFPNSMVDRITPASTSSTSKLAEGVTGMPDVAAVETEPFNQWVIKDNFAGPRPAWEHVGVLIVNDVEPFEKMKLRMLNGAHTLIAVLGAYNDLLFVRDVMADKQLAKIVRRHMLAASQTLEPVEGYSTEQYANDLITRFSNQAIDHRCLQIATDTSQKLPQRIFEPAFEAVKMGAELSTFALAFAAWVKLLSGRSKTGNPITLSDTMIDDLKAITQKDGSNFDRVVSDIVHLPGFNHFDVLNNDRFVAAAKDAYLNL